MMELTKSHNVEIVPATDEGNLRANEQSGIAKNTQPHELKDLMAFFLENIEETDRAGFSCYKFVSCCYFLIYVLTQFISNNYVFP